MDQTDRRIIAATQAGLPLCARPYHALAETLGIPAETIRQRLRAMLASGVIRRIGALPFVSHCYARPRRLPDWPYNLFAMVHGQSRDQVEEMVARIADRLGDSARGHALLYSTRLLKKTGLRIAG
jgi:DNA-binding Lrp family transcriptional regulator